MSRAAVVVEERLMTLAEPERVPLLKSYFRTGPGQYGEGDEFLGLRVPTLRKLVRELRALELEDTLALLASPYHEARLLALLLMVDQYERGDPASRGEIFRAYLANTHRIDNWDLVDLSAPRIVGAHLVDKGRSRLARLARSTSLWERRIAILATFSFIRKGDFSTTLEIAGMLLHDREDLIHKAVGWALREVGKKDQPVEEAFLARHYHEMPRTMLRYAIERFDPDRRRQYLRGEIGGPGT